MKKSYIINLPMNSDVVQFTKSLEALDSDINASFGSTMVDAKSYLGMASIACHPIVVEIVSDDMDEIGTFGSFCTPYLFKG